MSDKRYYQYSDEQYNRNFITYFLEPLGISFRFEDMPMYRKDTDI